MSVCFSKFFRVQRKWLGSKKKKKRKETQLCFYKQVFIIDSRLTSHHVHNQNS